MNINDEHALPYDVSPFNTRSQYLIGTWSDHLGKSYNHKAYGSALVE
jgi:hypothetical protein